MSSARWQVKIQMSVPWWLFKADFQPHFGREQNKAIVILFENYIS